MRIRLFLSLTLAIGLVVLCTVVIYTQFEAASDGSPTLAGGPVTSATTPSDEVPPVQVVPAAGQVAISGTVTAVHLDSGLLEPRGVATPLTVGSDRGFGNGGEIVGVQVAGAPASIVWDGGRPFALASGGALVLDPTPVDLEPDGFRLLLGGATHAFSPGTYELDTPVAVGTSGIASPMDQVTFTATADSRFEARGDASLLVGPEAPHRFVGPGTAHLEGTLSVVGADGVATSFGTFDLTDGAFDLTFTPVAGGGWTVTGVADAP